jgi:hypothetical protein
MKSQTIFQNRGFLTVEVMIAFSLLTLFIISTFTLSSTVQSMKVFSINLLDKLENSVHEADQFIKNDWSGDIETENLGNDTRVYRFDPFRIAHSNYQNGWGRDNCDPRIDFKNDEYEYIPSEIDIGIGNPSTDMEVRNGMVYLVADSSTASKPDLFIIDTEKNQILSSLNTGPGIRSLEVVGPYIFLAQASTLNELQVIDIHDRKNPILISQLKLSLPTPTSTAPFASSIFYRNGFVYLGTEKWNGEEFRIIDVSDVYTPKSLGSFETNTLVNDIYVEKDIAYLATSDEKQMRVLDISDRTKPVLIDSFSPSGWQTQEGKVLNYFEEILSFGRTVGGFNVINNHESFIFSTSTISTYNSIDVPGGVYGVWNRPPYIFLLTHFITEEFQVYKNGFGEKIYTYDFSNEPVKMVCDLKDFYFATGDSSGYLILKRK